MSIILAESHATSLILIFKVLTDSEITNYLEWSFGVTGHDYDWEQVNPESASLARMNRWEPDLFYPHAWGGLQRYGITPENGIEYYSALWTIDKLFTSDSEEEDSLAFHPEKHFLGVEGWVKAYRSKIGVLPEPSWQISKLEAMYMDRLKDMFPPDAVELGMIFTEGLSVVAAALKKNS